VADKLLVILLNTDPGNPRELAAPFVQAAMAVSKAYEVEIVFTGRAGKLERRGVAEGTRLPGSGERSVHDVMRDAPLAGVKFKVCAPALEMWGDDLVPEVEETVGAAYVIGEAMTGNCVTFTY